MGYPSSYQKARSMLGDRASRKIANNTYLESLPGGIGVRLHRTVVVFFARNGDIRLDTGNWFTVTTKSRMTACLRMTDWSIGSHHGAWCLFKSCALTAHERARLVRSGFGNSDLDRWGPRWRWGDAGRTNQVLLKADGSTTAEPWPIRTRRAHTNPDCRCAVCHPCGHQRWLGSPPILVASCNDASLLPIRPEPIQTPEAAVATMEIEETYERAAKRAGISDTRWSDYNRKMNALFAQEA